MNSVSILTLRTRILFFIATIGVCAVMQMMYAKRTEAAVCAPNPGGDYTTSQSCAFAGAVDGVDGGNLVVSAGTTLTINAGQTIVFNPGESLAIQGSVAINTTGQIKQTYLWMTDADTDGWSATLSTQYAQDNAPANGRRRSAMASLASADCNDNFYSTSNACYQGNGSDGALIVNGLVTINTTLVGVLGTASAGQAVVQIPAIKGLGFGIEDEVVIFQMFGTGAGTYETHKILAFDGSSITLDGNLVNTYSSVGSDRAQVIKIPNYTTVTVNNGGILTVQAWNGSTGGVMFFRASTSTVVNSGGTISVEGKGFLGGTGGVYAQGGFGSSGAGGGNEAISDGRLVGCQDNPVTAGSGGSVTGSGGGAGGARAVYYDCRGGNGGAGGGYTTLGTMNAGTAGLGLGGGSAGGGGNNQSNSTLTTILLGGGGGGGNSGYGGYGAGGGGGGGGGAGKDNADPGEPGGDGDFGGYGGGGGAGGTGGGIMIIKTLALTVNGTISAGASSGSAGITGYVGGPGGNGGSGGYGGGAGGGGGGGGKGGGGGFGGNGGGSGAGGSMILTASNLTLGNNLVTALSSAGGTAGAGGSGGTGGYGGPLGGSGSETESGSDGSSGGNGPSGSAGSAGSAGGSGKIRLEYNTIFGTTNPAPSSVGTPQ